MHKTGTYEPQGEYAKKFKADGKAEGKAEGEAKTIIMVLTARGITITDAARKRITDCTDIDQLDTWARRVGTVDTIDALFE